MTRFFETNAAVIFLLLVLVVVSVLLLNHAFQPTMDAIEWQEGTHQVQAGDSLWDIAGDYCPDGVDRREWVDEIQALNGLENSDIHPGQEITVLAPVE